jgi:hypothetical protein
MSDDLQIPISYIELIGKLRHARLNRVDVASMIDRRVKAAYMLRDFWGVNPDDTKIYAAAWERVKLPSAIRAFGTSLHSLGEAIIVAVEHDKMWEGLGLIPPDMVEVRQNPMMRLAAIPELYLRPHKTGQTLAEHPLAKELGVEVLASVLEASADYTGLMRFDRKHVTMLRFLSNTYDVRGTPHYPWKEALKEKNIFRENLDDKWLENRKAEQTQMELWLMDNFFGPLMAWHKLKELPTLEWAPIQ